MKIVYAVLMVGCCALFLATSCVSGPSAKPIVLGEQDAAIVLDRIRAEYLEKPLSQTGIDSLLDKLGANGAWPDIPYDSRQRSSWEPIDHMVRIRHLAAAGYLLGWKGDKAAIYAEAINRAFTFWYQRKPKSDNWWAWTIGVPQVQAPAMALCRDIVPTAMLETIYADLRQAGSEQEKWTGTNRTWIANNNLVLGLLTKDAGLISLALKALTEELRVVTNEGLQPDWSYHQHGPMLQTGNYGNSFLGTQVGLAGLLTGTSLAIEPAKQGLLTNYVLEHNQWLVWGQYFDLAASGRQLDSPNVFAGKARGLMSSIRDLVPLETARKGELEAVLSRYEATTTSGGPLGTRYWWRSDYLIGRSPDWTASLKMHSSRVMRVETWVNDENKLGLFANDGATWFRVRGDEQENLQPLLDWRRIPGVTGLDTTTPVPIKPSQKNYDAFNGGNAWVGGVSTGKVAIAVMDFSGFFVSANKAWFFLPEAVLCLGNDLQSQSAMFTAVNQNFRKGDVLSWDVSQTTGTVLAAGALTGHVVSTGDGRAIWHDSIGYVFPSGQGLKLLSELRTGSWKNLRSASTIGNTTGEVLQLELLHAKAPASYEYAVVPGLGPDAFAAFRNQLPWKTLANTEVVQAVWYEPAQALMLVFWKAGKFAAGSMQLQSDQPCLLVISGKGATRTMFVSDPGQTHARLEVRLDGKPYKVELPQGGMAGSTVQVIVPE